MAFLSRSFDSIVIFTCSEAFHPFTTNRICNRCFFILGFLKLYACLYYCSILSLIFSFFSYRYAGKNARGNQARNNRVAYCYVPHLFLISSSFCFSFFLRRLSRSMHILFKVNYTCCCCCCCFFFISFHSISITLLKLFFPFGMAFHSESHNCFAFIVTLRFYFEHFICSNQRQAANSNSTSALTTTTKLLDRFIWVSCVRLFSSLLNDISSVSRTPAVSVLSPQIFISYMSCDRSIFSIVPKTISLHIHYRSIQYCIRSSLCSTVAHKTEFYLYDFNCWPLKLFIKNGLLSGCAVSAGLERKGMVKWVRTRELKQNVEGGQMRRHGMRRGRVITSARTNTFRIEISSYGIE